MPDVRAAAGVAQEELGPDAPGLGVPGWAKRRRSECMRRVDERERASDAFRSTYTKYNVINNNYNLVSKPTFSKVTRFESGL